MKKAIVLVLALAVAVSGVFGAESSLNDGVGVENKTLVLTLGIKSSTTSGWFDTSENANNFTNALADNAEVTLEETADSSVAYSKTLYPAVKTNEAVRIQMTISGNPLVSESNSAHSIAISAEGSDYSNGSGQSSVTWSSSDKTGTLTYVEESAGTGSRVVTEPVTFKLTKTAYDGAVAANDYKATVTLAVEPATE